MFDIEQTTQKQILIACSKINKFYFNFYSHSQINNFKSQFSQLLFWLFLVSFLDLKISYLSIFFESVSITHD